MCGCVGGWCLKRRTDSKPSRKPRTAAAELQNSPLHAKRRTDSKPSSKPHAGNKLYLYTAKNLTKFPHVWEFHKIRRPTDAGRGERRGEHVAPTGGLASVRCQLLQHRAPVLRCLRHVVCAHIYNVASEQRSRRKLVRQHRSHGRERRRAHRGHAAEKE